MDWYGEVLVGTKRYSSHSASGWVGFARCKTMHLKANGLNPETYLNHLLSVLPERFAADPNASVADLLQWADAVREQFAALG